MIDSSPERVFQKVDDPSAAPRFLPDVTKVYDIHQGNNKIGDTFTVAYPMMGTQAHVKFTYTEYRPSNRLAARFEGSMTGVMTLDLEPQAGKTLATITVDYHLGGGFLGRIMNRLVFQRRNDKYAERLLGNIKTYSESA